MTLWLNGALHAPDDARIAPADRGFLLGDGVFETVRATAGAARLLDLHLARLRAGAAVLGIPLVWNDTAIAGAVAAVLEANHLESASVRITLSRGPAPRGVLPVGEAAPTLLITAAGLPPQAGPARVIIARSTRRNEASPLSRIKSLSYLDSIIARREAAAAGADDAILLNTRGRVAEATAANLFVLMGGIVATPPVEDGALPGIFRARLLAGGIAVERSMVPADLLGAEAALLGNSLGVRLVSALDGRSFDVAGSAARRLLARADIE